MFSISQVRDVLLPIQYLAERVDLIKILKLKHPDQDLINFVWSANTICEGFAIKNGFLNAKSGRPDIHRAGNLILRMCVEGKIILSFLPPLDELKSTSLDEIHEIDNEAVEEECVDGKEISSSTKKTKSEKKRLQKLQKQTQLLNLQV